MKETVYREFVRVFGAEGDVRCFFAPGRVNLIGEHTDYNGGYVFPCALTIGTYAVVRKRTDRRLRFYSVNYTLDGVVEASLDRLIYDKSRGWANYPMAVLSVLLQEGHVIDSGFDLLIGGNIPSASGLSSSSSVEVLTASIAQALYGLTLDGVTIALLTQKAENTFIGVNCGIMDQFAIAMGRPEAAIFLNTSNLNYEYVPLQLGEYRLVIGCTNKKRGLADSKYNERRSECEAALARLQTVCKIETLCDLSEAEFEAHKAVIGDEVLTRRARHAVYENQRTLKAVEALRAGDLVQMGQLMNESHRSLKEDYEVTGVELDTLVSEAWEQEGVLGARMTGAGFGGSTVAIVRADCVEQFIARVGLVYQEKIGYPASFTTVIAGGGPCEL